MKNSAFEFLNGASQNEVPERPVTSRKVAKQASRQPVARVIPQVETLSVEELERGITRWLRDCRMRGHTEASQKMNEFVSSKLLWFLRKGDYSWCDEEALSDFLLYVREGHKDPNGRWGDPHPRARKPISRSAQKTYYSYLKVLFNWLVKREVLDVSPMRRLSPPECRPDQLPSFSPEQIENLLKAAQRTQQRRRNVALLLFMLDTGARASEVCGLRHGDLDFDEGRASLFGKGEKRRDVYLGQTACRALYEYLAQEGRDLERDAHQHVFLSERGGALTASGLRQLYERLSKEAGLRATRCYPHKMRRTFATEYLNNGAPLKDVQRLMGHASDKQTMVYLYSADARVRENHRQYSPADRLRPKGKRK